MLINTKIPLDTIRADGSVSAFPPPAAVAVAVQNCVATGIGGDYDKQGLRFAIAQFEQTEPGRIHTACCPFAILMRGRVVDQRALLRPQRSDDNRIYLRDFSRFGLGGINVCYAISDEGTVARLDRLPVPGPDKCAAAAATAAIKDIDCAEKLIAATEKLRDETAGRLQSMGYPVKQGDGAFVELYCDKPDGFVREMLKHGVLVEKSDSCVRIWICPTEEMERICFILNEEKALKKLSAFKGHV